MGPIVLLSLSQAVTTTNHMAELISRTIKNHTDKSSTATHASVVKLKVEPNQKISEYEVIQVLLREIADQMRVIASAAQVSPEQTEGIYRGSN